MNRDQFDAYLAAFNRRDYDAVLSQYTQDGEIVFAGYAFKGHQAVRDFYAFFHAHVDERINVQRFVADDHTVVLEATVRLEGKSALTSGMLEAKGLGNLFQLEKGQVVEVPQFIHYHLRDGKFAKALCAIFDVPQKTITAL